MSVINRIAGYGIAFPLCCLVIAASIDITPAWQVSRIGTTEEGYFFDADDLVLDHNDNVIAVGVLDITQDNHHFSQFGVVKVSGATGSQMWRTIIADRQQGSGAGKAVVVDARGDVIAFGFFVDEYGQNLLTVVKLDNATGQEVWRYRSGTGPTWVLDIAIDAAGDVIAAGNVEVGGGIYAFHVVKLNGSNGSEIWRRDIYQGQGVSRVQAVAVDSVGDVYAAGAMSISYQQNELFVARLSGATGNVLWTYRARGSAGTNDFATGIALDEADDVVVVGRVSNTTSLGDLFACKLSHDSGTEIWKRIIDGSAGGHDEANAVVVVGSSDVIIGGQLNGGWDFGEAQVSGEDFVVMKLSGETGEELWIQSVRGPAGQQDVVYDVTVDVNDDVVAVGEIAGVESSHDFAVLKLSGLDGTVAWDVRINGTAPAGEVPGSASNDLGRRGQVDSLGNVLALGLTDNASGQSATIVKRDGNTGQEVGPTNHSPIASAGSDRLYECGGRRTLVALDGRGSYDDDGDMLTFSWRVAYDTFHGPTTLCALEMGSYKVILTVEDGRGGFDIDDAIVEVRDTLPPTLTGPFVSPSVLWPPNHRMVDVLTSVSASDDCTSYPYEPQVYLVSIVSSEPDDSPGTGDGESADDIQNAVTGSEDISFQLRAERDGNGQGRGYLITYGARDASGNIAMGTSVVIVPHDVQGVVEPVIVSVENDISGTRVVWDVVSTAQTYDVIRGSVSNVRENVDGIDLGAVSCIRSDAVSTTTQGYEDSDIPPPGEAFFYLVGYNNGWESSGYGTASAMKPRIVASGDCE